MKIRKTDKRRSRDAEGRSDGRTERRGGGEAGKREDGEKKRGREG